VFALNFYQNRKLKIAGVPIDGAVTVGRELDNGVILSHSSVSRHHAVFSIDSSGPEPLVLLRDLGSTNGCFVNDTKLKGDALRVGPDDLIKVGIFRVEVIDKPATWGLPPSNDEREQTILYESPPIWRESLPVDRMRALYEFASQGTQLGSEELLALASKKISACLEFDVLCILVRNGPSEKMVRTWDRSGACSPSRVSISRSVLEKCLRERVAILADKKEEGDEEGTRGWNAMTSALCVPLLSGDQSVGAIYVDSKSPTVIYGKEDLQYLILIANTVASNLSIRKVLQDLREEAQKLEAILSSLQEGVLITDKDFRIISTNSTAVTIFGGKKLVGTQLQEALAGLSHTFHPRALPGRACFQLETPPEGKSRPRSVYVATVSKNTESEQQGWHYVICLHDITESQRLERMKAMLVNRLAHKLRTPLTVISGVNSLLASTTAPQLDAELKGLVQQAAKRSDECAALIERFVEYTSLNLDHGAALALYGACALEELVASAVDTNAELITKTAFRVVRRFPPNTFVVQGDGMKLRLVFLHIIENAVKFGKPGGFLEIDAEESDGTIRIRFLDNGPGIPPTELENIFQMLHQVDADDTGEVPGAGLGLWFARDIVQAHGGNIRITSPASPDGGGTLVEVLLPAVARESRPARDVEWKSPTVRIARDPA